MRSLTIDPQRVPSPALRTHYRCAEQPESWLAAAVHICATGFAFDVATLTRSIWHRDKQDSPIRRIRNDHQIRQRMNVQPEL